MGTKKSIFERFIISLTCHPWLKIISLILAVVIWLYVRGGERI